MIKKLLARYLVSKAEGCISISKFERALTLSRWAFFLDRTCAKALALRSWIRVTQFLQPEGMYEFSVAVGLNPSDIDIRLYRAGAYCALGEHNKALADAEHILTIQPNDTRAHVIWNLAYGSLKQYVQSSLISKQALEAQSDNRIMLQALAFLYNGVGEYEQAKLLRNNSTEPPRYSYPFLERAMLRKYLGNNEGAHSDFARALRVNIDLPHEIFVQSIERSKHDPESAVVILNDLLFFCADSTFRDQINIQLHLLAQSS